MADYITKPGTNYVFDPTTDDIVGVMSPDGSVELFGEGGGSADEAAKTPLAGNVNAVDNTIYSNNTANNYTVTIQTGAVTTGLVAQQNSTGTVSVIAGAGVTFIPSGNQVTVDEGDQIVVTPTSVVDTFQIDVAGESSRKAMVVADIKSNGTPGGDANSGSRITRTLNTIKSNSIPGASLASNQITLPAGKYLLKCSAPSYRTAKTATFVRNVTASTDLLQSVGYTFASGTGVQVYSAIDEPITLTEETVLEIQQVFETSYTSIGLGFDGGPLTGTDEQYTTVTIEKL